MLGHERRKMFVGTNGHNNLTGTQVLTDNVTVALQKKQTEKNSALPLSTNDPFTTGGQCDPAVFLPTEGDVGSGTHSHIGRNNLCMYTC